MDSYYLSYPSVQDRPILPSWYWPLWSLTRKWVHGAYLQSLSLLGNVGDEVVKSSTRQSKWWKHRWLLRVYCATNAVGSFFLARSWNKQVNKQILHWPCKLVWSRWLDIILVHFCIFMDLNFVSVYKKAKRELCQYLAILAKQAWSITHSVT